MLKDSLTKESIVRMYNPQAAVTEIHIGASAVALSRILLQGETSKS